MIRYKRKKKSYSFWITLGLLLLLIIFSQRNPKTTALPSKLLNTVISPINSIFYTISQSAQDLYDQVFGDRASQARIDRLVKENKALTEKIQRLGTVVADSEVLKESAKLRALNPDQMVEAHVSGMDPSNHFVRFTINKGSASGIREGDVVIEGVKTEEGYSSAGLVGKVVEVGLTYAKVSSLMDQANNVSVLFAESTGYGIINSRDAESFFGYLLDPSTPVKEGEAVLSSGMGGVYPRGLYVGQVSKVETTKDGLTKNVAIRSVIDYNRLYDLLVFHSDESLNLGAQNKPAQDQAPANEEARSSGGEGGDHE